MSERRNGFSSRTPSLPTCMPFIASVRSLIWKFSINARRSYTILASNSRDRQEWTNPEVAAVDRHQVGSYQWQENSGSMSAQLAIERAVRLGGTTVGRQQNSSSWDSASVSTSAYLSTFHLFSSVRFFKLTKSLSAAAIVRFNKTRFIVSVPEGSGRKHELHGCGVASAGDSEFRILTPKIANRS